MSKSVKCVLTHREKIDYPRIKSEVDSLMKENPELSKDDAMRQVAENILSELQTQERSMSVYEYQDLAVKPGMSNEKLDSMIAQYAGVEGKPRVDAMKEALSQYRLIESLYFNKDGSHKEGAMLAPNGKPTNLNKVQWIMTRTENFNNWFSGSKIIDENGDPLVVYHGTTNNLNSFSSESNKGGGIVGIYFTRDKHYAEMYGHGEGKSVYATFLKIDNPKIITAQKQTLLSKTLEAVKPSRIEERKDKDNESKISSMVLRKSDVQEIESNGFDGIDNILASEIIVFDPSQIKSAIGNTGTFNGASNDIRFSVVSPADLYSSAATIPPTTAEDVYDRIKAILSKGKSKSVDIGLSALTQNQIIEVGKPVLPILQQFQKARNSYDVEESKWHNRASKIAERWEKLAPNYKKGDKFFNKQWKHRNKIEQMRLSDVMHDMTVSGIDPRKNPPKPTDTNGIAVKLYYDLKEKYDTLLPDTKKLLDDVEVFHQDVISDLTQSLVDKIEMSEMPEENKQKLITDITKKFKTQSGPYFPLMRFGNYWVDYKGGTQMFESKAEQDKFIEQQKKAGVTINGYGKSLQDFQKVEGVDVGFVDDVNKLIDNMDVAQADQLKDGIFQLYLSALPESSMRKRFIHRKKTPGWEQDALRSFAKKSFHDGKQLAKLKYAPVMQKVLNDARDIVKTGNSDGSINKLKQRIKLLPEILDKLDNHVDYADLDSQYEDEEDKKIIRRFERFTDDADREKAIGDYLTEQESLLKNIEDYKKHPNSRELATDVINALSNSFDNMTNSTTSGLTNLINQTVFTYMLGFNPASAMINMFQAPGVSLPVAAGRHGFGKASKELADAYKTYFSNKTDNEFSIKSGLKNQGEMDMFDALTGNGTFDRTRSHDLAGLSEEGISRGTLHRDFMMASTFMFHKAEVANREITALMAYRLEFAKTGDVAKSIEYANDLVRDTHLDYSSANRPDLFQGNAARVMMQFKMYSQGMTYLWGKTAYDALISKNVSPERKTEARNIILSLIGVQTAFAGILGLPIGGLLMAAQMLASFMDDDDDPVDIEIEIRKALNAVLGDDIGRIMARGALSETGADFAGRLSLSDLWIREPDRELEGKDEAYYLLKTILGPSAGILEKVLIGMKFIGDGDSRRGVEAMLPNSLSGVAKAYRSIDEGGATSNTGNMIYETSRYEQALQAIGMRPSGLAEQMAQNSAIKNRESAVADTKGKLLHRAVRAKLNNDKEAYDEVWADIKEFNAKYKDRKITPSTIAKSIKTRRKNKLEAKNGIVIKKKDSQIAAEEQII